MISAFVSQKVESVKLEKVWYVDGQRIGEIKWERVKDKKKIKLV